MHGSSRNKDLNLNVTFNRQVGVLPNLYQAVLFYVLWVTWDFGLGDLLKMSGNKQQNVKRCRYKGFPAHPPAFSVFLSTVRSRQRWLNPSSKERGRGDNPYD
jgi:hypothetical protein